MLFLAQGTIEYQPTPTPPTLFKYTTKLYDTGKVYTFLCITVHVKNFLIKLL